MDSMKYVCFEVYEIKEHKNYVITSIKSSNINIGKKKSYNQEADEFLITV
jgi:hypothetical protein